ncbi:hypothetical protein HMPREF9441_01315 [Paraprevotella clara YIT 11840]|uniref:Uncharacterized protein n=1 Tax=Paraprevotella clara YIT 11840 TaxID=762968 RepID=G5SPN2_9BACT|nr:hypothetical protein HMPREF9441_01315 [Paraprevotella clara YIT 11840]
MLSLHLNRLSYREYGGSVNDNFLVIPEGGLGFVSREIKSSKNFPERKIVVN